MKLSLQSIRAALYKISKNPYLLFAILISVWASASAAGTDILAGADANLTTTFKGTLSKILLAVEGLFCIITYMKSRNVTALLGVVVVSLFIDGLFLIFVK